MVKIINGEVVPDNDPRAQEWSRRQSNSSHNVNRNNRNSANTQQQTQQLNGQQSPLADINNKLRGLGIPNLTLGGQVVEPVFIVAAVLSLVFWGFPGLIIVALVWYFMTKHNQQ